MLLPPQERIRLARQIEKAEYRNFQACLHNSWIEQAAAALEIELEEEMYKGAPGQGVCSPFSFYLVETALISVIPSGAARYPFLVLWLLPLYGPDTLGLSCLSDSLIWTALGLHD